MQQHNIASWYIAGQAQTASAAAMAHWLLHDSCHVMTNLHTAVQAQMALAVATCSWLHNEFCPNRMTSATEHTETAHVVQEQMELKVATVSWLLQMPHWCWRVTSSGTLWWVPMESLTGQPLQQYGPASECLHGVVQRTNTPLSKVRDSTAVPPHNKTLWCVPMRS